MERKSHPHSFHSVRMDHNIFHKCHDFASAAFWRGRNLETIISIIPSIQQRTNYHHIRTCSVVASHTIFHSCICQVNHSGWLHSKL